MLAYWKSKDVSEMGMIPQVYKLLVQRQGGSKDEQFVLWNRIMEQLHMRPSTADAALKLYEHPETAGAKKAGGKTPEQLVAEEKAAAAAWMGKFSTTGESLAVVVNRISGNIALIRDKMDFLHPLDAVKKFIGEHPGVTASLVTGGASNIVAPAIYQAFSLAASVRRSASTDRAPTAQEADRFHVPITLQPGAVTVQAGDPSVLGGAVEKALQLLKFEIMSEIEDQWRRAQHA
jgi:hypothetical protein